MDAKIENKKRKIEELKIQVKVKQREKQRKKLWEIGRLAKSEEIDALDSRILLGAFLEIAEKMPSKETRDRWAQLADKKTERENKLEGTKVAVVLKADPGKEVRDRMKSVGFVWNKFRCEFYGRAREGFVEKLLGKIEHQVDILESF